MGWSVEFTDTKGANIEKDPPGGIVTTDETINAYAICDDINATITALIGSADPEVSAHVVPMLHRVRTAIVSQMALYAPSTSRSLVRLP